jgi:hypothetical protein
MIILLARHVPEKAAAAQNASHNGTIQIQE